MVNALAFVPRIEAEEMNCSIFGSYIIYWCKSTAEGI
jgi:hypothetical protein